MRLITRYGAEEVSRIADSYNDLEGWILSEEAIRASIRGTYKALIGKDVEGALSFYADDATLVWGPYTFKGREEIRKWATEVTQQFEKLFVMETGLTVEGNKATHGFVIQITTSDGFRGRLPGIGVYEFRDGKIQSVKVVLSRGAIVLKREEARLYFTKTEYAMYEESR